MNYGQNHGLLAQIPEIAPHVSREPCKVSNINAVLMENFHMITASNKNQNPGIVPPWLSQPVQAPSRNPGIVPPWLSPTPVTPNGSINTSFVREPADALSPTPGLAEALRSR